MVDNSDYSLIILYNEKNKIMSVAVKTLTLTQRHNRANISAA